MSCDVLFLRVTSVLWLLRGRRSGRARCVCKSRCSCGTGNQDQHTCVALVNPVAQRRGLPNRTADNTKWTAKWTLGFHGIPAGSLACKKQRYEAIKRSWAAVGRRSPSDLVMSMYSESLTSLKQRSRMRHTRFVLLDHVDRKEQQRARLRSLRFSVRDCLWNPSS